MKIRNTLLLLISGAESTRLNTKLLERVITFFYIISFTSTLHALPTGFSDLGASTVDRNTGLEWLDLTATLGRNVLDVHTETKSSSGLGANGWRVATTNEWADLMESFFQIDVHDNAVTNLGDFLVGFNPDNPNLAIYGRNINLEPKLREFINTFGLTGSPFSPVGNVGYLLINGVSWMDQFENGLWHEGLFGWQGTISIDVGGSEHDLIYLDGYHPMESPTSGTYLVRIAEVSEPSTLNILVLGLIAISLSRKGKSAVTKET
jgi:hypothetical protein